MSAENWGFITLTGIVLRAEPIGEYDKRVVMLTKERGKISAFAKGARHPGNRLMAAASPFCFGQFKLYEGKSSYSMAEADISNFFEELRADFKGAYYGMYFLEICDYYTRENCDETGMLKLVYQSLRALVSASFDDRLVRCVFEIKAIALNGEFPGIGADDSLSDGAIYTVNYIVNTPPSKLYSFSVKQNVLYELCAFCRKICEKTFDKNFKSLEMIETLENAE